MLSLQDIEVDLARSHARLEASVQRESDGLRDSLTALKMKYDRAMLDIGQKHKLAMLAVALENLAQIEAMSPRVVAALGEHFKHMVAAAKNEIKHRLNAIGIEIEATDVAAEYAKKAA